MAIVAVAAMAASTMRTAIVPVGCRRLRNHGPHADIAVADGDNKEEALRDIMTGGHSKLANNADEGIGRFTNVGVESIPISVWP